MEMTVELRGSVARPGKYELEEGILFRELLKERAGGVAGGAGLKALLPDGPLSPALDAAEALSVRLDSKSISALGSSFGSGELIVVGDKESIVDVLLATLDGFASGCCQRRATCREAAAWMRSIVRRIAGGAGRAGDDNLLLDVALSMERCAGCDEARLLARAVTCTVTKFGAEVRGRIEGRTP